MLWIISLFCKNSGSSCCLRLLLPHQHTPTRVATDVNLFTAMLMQMYKAGDWCKCWGQSTDVLMKSLLNNTRKLSNFNYQELHCWRSFDLSDMTKMHVDLWSSGATSKII
jgi:hypothetical protein